MKILMLNDDPPDALTSVSSIMRDLTRAYGDAGHEVHVLTTHRIQESPDVRHEGNITSLPISYRPSLRSWLSLFSPRAWDMVSAELERIRPDAVHAHNVHMYLTYDALRIARRHAPRVILTAHDAMSVCYGRLATDRFLDSGGEDARLTPLDHLRQAGLQWNPFRNPWIRSVIRKNVSRVCAVSGALGRALAANGIPRVTTVRNGLDLQPWMTDAGAAFREKHGLGDRPVILFGGRISEDKGAVCVLRALELVRESVPDVRLLVIGDRRRWEGIPGSADAARCVVAPGWLPAEEVRAAYHAANVVTTPSVYLDAFNMMNLEAMAAGKPVVGTMFGGTPEIVEHGVTGFVCDPRKTEEYAGYLRRLLTDAALARQMGEAGRKRAEEHFTVKQQAERYLELLSG